MQIKGHVDLARALEKLPVDLRKTVESSALRAGMAPVLKSARSNAASSRDSGLLQRSLGMTVKKGRSGQLSARVGTRGGFRQQDGVYTRGKNKGKPKYKDPIRYAHLVEYGTSRTVAKPFIRPAIESNREKIVYEMAKGYQKGLDRVIKKIRK